MALRLNPIANDCYCPIWRPISSFFLSLKQRMEPLTLGDSIYVPLVVTGLLPKVTSRSLHIGLMAPVWLPVASVLFGLTS